MLWVVESDGQISAPVDLHPVPGIQSIVEGISDETADGKVYVAGHLDFQAAVWVVDVATRSVIDVQLQPDGGGAKAVNAAGEVLVTVSGPAVWTLATGLLEPLPTLSKQCTSGGGGINNAGTVAGSSGLRAKGRCTTHAVVWTKKP